MQKVVLFPDMLNGLLNALPDGVLLLSPQLTVTAVNQKLLAWTHSEAGSLVGQARQGETAVALSNLWANGDEIDGAITAVYEQKAFDRTLSGWLQASRAEAATPRWVTWQTQPIYDGEQLAGWLELYRDLTDYKQLQMEYEALQQTTAEWQQMEERTAVAQARASQSLEKMSAPLAASLTAGFYGQRPLHDSEPDLFRQFVAQYQHILHQAIEARLYKTEFNPTQHLQQLAEQLGQLWVRSRDVVELHMVALQARQAQNSPTQQIIYADEGRLLLLELIGFLAAHYRNHALGRPQRVSSISNSQSKE